MEHTRSLYFTRLRRIAQTAGEMELRCFRYLRGIARQMVGDLKTKAKGRMEIELISAFQRFQRDNRTGSASNGL